MGLFKKRPKTSEQKAQKAQMGIAVRVIGCAYLIYVIFQMFKSAPENDSISPTTKYVIAAVFLAAAIAIIAATLREFIRNMKSGYYKSSAYTDDITPDDEDSTESELPEPDESAEKHVQTEDAEKSETDDT